MSATSPVGGEYNTYIHTYVLRVICTTDKDNAEAARSHFHGVYNRQVEVDRSVLSLVRQREVKECLGGEPDEAEVAVHLRKAKAGKACGENGLHVELFQRSHRILMASS